MGLINKVDMVCLSPVGYGVLADVSSVGPSSEQTHVHVSRPMSMLVGPCPC